MSWPAPVQAGEASTANQYNALLENLQTWGGDVNAGGYALTNLATLTVAGAVTVTAPDKLKLGSGWTTYAPTFSAAAGMTVSNVAVSLVQALRRSAHEMLVQVGGSCTLGGTAAGYLYVSLPAVPVGGNLYFPYEVALASNGLWVPATALLDVANNRVACGMPGAFGQSFPLGMLYFMVALAYRVG